VVNADDFGRSPGVNEGIIQAHEQGVVTSASLMTRWPAAPAAAAYLRRRSQLSGGLHVDLGEWEWTAGEWRARYQVAAPGDVAALRAAIEQQLGRFRALVGRDPTHLDSHQHVHRREPARSVLADLARTLGVPLRHAPGGARYCGDFYGQTETGEPLPSHVTAEHLVALIEGVVEGVTELACHPASRTDFDDTYGATRLLEVPALCDQRVRDAITSRGIELVSFAALAAPGRGPAAPGASEEHRVGR
jgi:predicted glycoside hydrolase/deacetylase ChbG (UPF0249 family)